MVRADRTQIVSVCVDAFVHESVVARNVDASVRHKGWTELVVIEKWIKIVGNQ